MEVQTVQSLHGTTAPDWLAREGLLNDRILAPHATNATDTDLAHYAENGVSVVHCPLVAARGGSILRSFGTLRARGINIAMGTDTAPADMLLNLLTGLMTARIADPAAPHQQSADFWDAATLGGARALGRDDLGRLTPGACADIAVFRLDDAIMTPAIDPITTLIAGGSGKVTQATFVDGRLSMCEGRVAGLDMATATARAQGQFDGLARQIPRTQLAAPAGVRAVPAQLPHPTKGSPMTGTPMLDVRALRVEFPGRHGTVTALADISLTIQPGEILGVVGESGAGKSMTGLAVLGLLEPPGHVAGGEVWLNGRRIDQLSDREMEQVRGREIGAIFQDPLTSLNPLFSVGKQLIETIRLHLP